MTHKRWTRGNAHGCGEGLAICEGPIVIARVLGDGYPTGVGNGPRSEAIADLIAAAPDMLAALEALVWVATHHMSSEEERREALRQSREAIAKAKGDGDKGRSAAPVWEWFGAGGGKGQRLIANSACNKRESGLATDSEISK